MHELLIKRAGDHERAVILKSCIRWAGQPRETRSTASDVCPTSLAQWYTPLLEPDNISRMTVWSSEWPKQTYITSILTYCSDTLNGDLHVCYNYKQYKLPSALCYSVHVAMYVQLIYLCCCAWVSLLTACHTCESCALSIGGMTVLNYLADAIPESLSCPISLVLSSSVRFRDPHTSCQPLRHSIGCDSIRLTSCSSTYTCTCRCLFVRTWI